MSKDGAGDAPDGALGNVGEDGVAQLGEEAGADAGKSICSGTTSARESVRGKGGRVRRTANDDGTGDGKDALAGGRVDLDVERVDDVLEEEGDLDVEELLPLEVRERLARR